MPFTHDAAPESTPFSLLPDGDYDLVITKTEERKSAKGFNMVNVTCDVINSAEYNGRKVFYNVTFLPKETNGKPTPGAGMSTHFLKTIGQPFEGAIQVVPDDWIGNQFKAKIGTREYETKRGAKRQVNDVLEVMPTADLPF